MVNREYRRYKFIKEWAIMNENMKWDEKKKWTYSGRQEELVMDCVIRG